MGEEFIKEKNFTGSKTKNWREGNVKDISERNAAATFEIDLVKGRLVNLCIESFKNEEFLFIFVCLSVLCVML